MLVRAILLLFLVSLCAITDTRIVEGATTATRPADGVYQYDIVRGGTTIGISRVTVHTSATAVRLEEHITAGPLDGTTTIDFDPGTLTEDAYRATASMGGHQTTVVVTPLNGSLDIRVADQSVDVAALPQAPFLLVGDNFVASMVLIPAIVSANDLARYTDVLLAGAKPVDAHVVAGGMPGSMSVDLGGTSVAFDYDPATFLVRTIRVPAQDVTISLHR